MNREILFRGKRTDNGEWVEGAFIPDVLESLCGQEVSWGFIRRYNKDKDKLETLEVDRDTVGEYTGLTDKNGVKIFEGNILKYEGNQYEVIWDKYGWKCKGFYNSGYDYPSEAFSEGMGGFEVIGNIHDKEENNEFNRR